MADLDPNAPSSVNIGPPPARPVRLPVMRQRWEMLSFLHWEYPVETVRRLVPTPFEIDAWEGRAWVGLVAFHMQVRPPVGPALPGVTTFPEVNVRTYVIGPNGRPGVWFFSLDAPNGPAVVTARLLYGLPYYFAAMRVRVNEGQVSYHVRRRGLHSTGVGAAITVLPGGSLGSEETTAFDHYLTARFLLWARHWGWTFSVPVQHPPWALRRGLVLQTNQNLLETAGLPAPVGDPILHCADGVDVRLGIPERFARRRLGTHDVVAGTNGLQG